jgi:hypothetical protein
MSFLQHRQWLLSFARLIVVCPIISWASNALAQEVQDVPTPSNYGGVGLLDMRTARFYPDGYLALSVSRSQPDDRYSITVQALPWAELTFRYAIIHGEGLFDRSFDMKFHLSHETEYVPELALGMQDILGTGVYSGEYVVATKQWGPVDFTMGLGWGRLGSRGTFNNPFSIFGHSFLDRQNNQGQGGVPLFKAYFHGPDVGLFGGIEYKTPIENLNLKVEYSSDAYTSERTQTGKDYSYPVNVGLDYRPFPWLDVSLSLMHGHYGSLRISTLIDAASENWTSRIDPAPRFRARPAEVAPTLLEHNAPAQESGAPVTRVVDLTAEREPPPAASAAPAPSDAPAPSAEPAPSTTLVPNATVPESSAPNSMSSPNMASSQTATPLQPGSGLDPNVETLIRQGIASQQLPLQGLGVEGTKLVIIVENNHYRRDSDAISRTARVLSATTPPNVEYFEITVTRLGLPLTTVSLPREQIDKLAQGDGSPAELFEASQISPGLREPLDHIQPGLFPDASAFLFPVFRQDLFDPSNPIYVRLGIGGDVGLRLARGLFLETSVVQSLFDNFNQITRETNSVLPHVRSDITHYLKEGKFELSYLAGSYFFKFSPEIYGRLSAGYLEEMYAGAGGELLYRPFGQRWSIGVDLWTVRQRDYHVLFDLRHYQALTGHITAYYELPWHDVRIAVSAGQYLAGDKGLTFEFFRRFSTGVQIGAWFSQTNVSAKQFGEGSFDKGIRIIIPFEWAAPFATRTGYDFSLRSIQRDGAQKLDGAAILYDVTEPSSYGTLLDEWNSVFR